jgi:MFS transporter, ACS family, glucarate transporter
LPEARGQISDERMNEPKPLSAVPTRVRYSVLGILCFLAMITYLDRAMIGNARDDIMASVGQPGAKFYYLLTAFQIAYALFEVPSGWMGDRFGPRSTLLRIVVWWSVCIALTACAGATIPGLDTVLIGFTALIFLQFLFGMGEAGAFPNITRALYNWFPATQRGSAQGTIWLSARFMGGMTPMIWLLLSGPDFLGLTWRQTLWLFAGLAGAWCVIFSYWFRNLPEEHSSVNAAERDLIDVGRTPHTGHDGVPWGKILRSRNLWYMCAMYMVTNFCWYFLMYFLPGVMKDQFKSMTATPSGKLLVALFAGSPLVIGMLGCVVGGLLTDRYVRRTGDRKWGRRIVPMFGYAMAGVCYLLAAVFFGNFWAFAICLMMMGFFNDLMMASAWATCQDVGRRYSAIVSGSMNMIGNLGAALGNFITGSVFEAHQDNRGIAINIMFTTYAVLYGVGVLLWLKIDASKPIVPDAPAEEAGTIVLDE